MTNTEFYDKIYNGMYEFAQEYVKDETPRTVKYTRVAFHDRAKEICADVVKESQVRHKPSRTTVDVYIKSLAPKLPRVWIVKLNIGTGNLVINFRMDFEHKECTASRTKL